MGLGNTCSFCLLSLGLSLCFDDRSSLGCLRSGDFDFLLLQSCAVGLLGLHDLDGTFLFLELLIDRFLLQLAGHCRLRLLTGRLCLELCFSDICIALTLCDRHLGIEFRLLCSQIRHRFLFTYRLLSFRGNVGRISSDDLTVFRRKILIVCTTRDVLYFMDA